MARLKCAVFVSGRGSNLVSIVEKSKNQSIDAEVCTVISNRSTAGGLLYAKENGIPAYHISQIQFESEDDFANALINILHKEKSDLLVLAGYLKKLPKKVIKEFKNHIINIHPALLPAFGGKGMFGENVHKAVLQYGCKVSGATVHIVDDQYDTGFPLVQRCVPVMEDDTPATLAKRILVIEHQILPEAIQLYAQDKIKIKNNRPFIHF